MKFWEHDITFLGYFNLSCNNLIGKIFIRTQTYSLDASNHVELHTKNCMVEKRVNMDSNYYLFN